MEQLTNLADDYAEKAADEANQNSGIGEEVENDPDPLITPPLYGRSRGLMRRLLLDINGDRIPPSDNRAHDLNLDPVFRVPAGFGTKVVQEKQEEYMSPVWEQIGEVI